MVRLQTKKSCPMSSYFKKLYNTLSILKYPKFFEEFFSSRVFSAPCFELNKALQCYQSSFKTILDVGANVGQFALAANFHFPSANIYSFEPLPNEFSELLRNTNRKTRIKVYNCALGSQSGKLPFYYNQYSRLSSSRPIDSMNDQPRYRERKTSVIDVDVVRLDELSKTMTIESPVLLKIDVQGMEKEVLLGCGGFLGQVDFLLCEVSLVTLYTGQPLFEEMHSFIRDLGYRLVAPLYLNSGKDGRIIEMDVLYVKSC
jgi:FkbM family methyltransferase